MNYLWFWRGLYYAPVFKKRSCCSALYYWNVSFTAELRYLKFSLVPHFLPHLPRISSRWFLFIWSWKISLFQAILTYPQEKSCWTDSEPKNGWKTHWRNDQAYTICHRLDKYSFVKRQTSFFVNVYSKLSTINGYFNIPTFFIKEH